MKILQVIHDFLPRHQAGSELYCFHLSKAQQSLGHEVRLFFAEIDHQRPAYATREGVYQGLPFLEIVNNHAYRNFAETYSNPRVEEVFERLLRDFRPDVVHFHHLLSLSFGCARICKSRGIPAVFTLHDYWLTCPRGGGQRFRGEGKICHEVDTRLCAECVARHAFPSSRGLRALKRVFAFLEAAGDPTLLSLLERGRIETLDPSYVTRGRCGIGGDARDVLFAHPPSAVTFRRDVEPGTTLVFAVAMDPSTYEAPGDGVRFTIHCEEALIFEKFLHPKQHPGERGWHEAAVDLGPFRGKKRTFRFATEARPTGRADFCAACWAEPKLVCARGTAYQPSASSRFRSLAESVIGGLRRNQLRAQVERRSAALRALFGAVDLFIAPSPFLRQKFIDYGLPRGKIVCSDYGIASRDFGEAPRQAETPVRFTYIGTIVEHKGLHVLIEAFNRLPPGSALLNVYGDLSEFTGYVRRIQAMIAHPGITLRGRAENHEIARILSESHVLVVPSIWFENSPITIHEAFLARVPVITARFGGMADLVQDGVNGLLFEVGDPGSLFQCLQRCVADPAMLDTLRPRPESVKTIQADAEWMVSLYRTLRGK
ncbi:MAG: glycosyltransferase [bacterium]